MRLRLNWGIKSQIFILAAVLLWWVWADAAETNSRPTELPQVELQPRYETVWAGRSVTFTLRTNGSPPTRIQWFFKGAPLPGATNSTLTLVDAEPGNSGEYHVVASNNAGAITSAVASLTVKSLLNTNLHLDFGLQSVGALQAKLFNIPIWQYLATLIYVVLAFATAKIIDWVVRTRLRGWTASTQTKLDDILLRLLEGPIKVVVFVVLLHIGFRIFAWPDFIEDYVSRGLQIIVAVSITYLALKIVDLLLNYWRQRASSAEDRALADHLLPFISNAAKIFIVIVAALLTLETLGVKITGLIASLSVGGLAIGLAAQDTLANLFGAVSVFVDKPFRVGDYIRLDQVEGRVEVIGMRSTRVRTPDGHLVAIPNKTVGNAVITNIAKRPTIRTVMNIGLTYDTSAERMKRALAILQDIYGADPMTKEVAITFNRFGDFALNIEVIHFWNSNDIVQYRKGIQALNLKVKERFDTEGISFAFPTQTIHVKHVDAA